MLALRETTKWKGDTPNHTYLLDGNMLVAYIPAGESTPVTLRKRMRFNRAGREFQQVPEKLFKAPKTSLLRVKGSNGNIYEVDKDEKTCTCPGFTYRGYCKHLENA